MNRILKAALPLMAIVHATPGFSQDVVMRRPLPSNAVPSTQDDCNLTGVCPPSDDPTVTPPPAGPVSANIMAQLCLGGQSSVICQRIDLDADGNVVGGDVPANEACLSQPDDASFQKVYDLASVGLPSYLVALRPAQVAAAIAAQGSSCDGGADAPTVQRQVYGGTCAVGATDTTCSQFSLEGDGDGTVVSSEGTVDQSYCESAQTISSADEDFVAGLGYVPITSDTSLTQACSGKGADDYAIDAICNQQRSLIKTCYYATTSGRIWEIPCNDIKVPGLPNSVFTHEEDVTAALGGCVAPESAGKHIDIYKKVTQDGTEEGSTDLQVDPVARRTNSNLTYSALGVTTCLGDTSPTAGYKYLVCNHTAPGVGNPKVYGSDVVNFTYTYSLPYTCTSNASHEEIDVSVADCVRQRSLKLAGLRASTLTGTSFEQYFSSFQSYANSLDQDGYYSGHWFYFVPAGQFDNEPLVSKSTRLGMPAPLSVVDDSANKRFVVTEHFYRELDSRGMSYALTNAQNDISYIYGAGL